MLDLIDDYEQTRFQLQKRIYQLNKILKTESLRTMEKERLTARKDLLTRERTELLNSILDMRKHLKEEEKQHVQYSGKYARLQSFPDSGPARHALHQPETAGTCTESNDTDHSV